MREQLELIEALDREIDDLTSFFKARLAPNEFRLVWALRDAVERLAIADELMRERRLMDGLAWHLPQVATDLAAVRRHIVGDDTVADEIP